MKIVLVGEVSIPAKIILIGSISYTISLFIVLFITRLSFSWIMPIAYMALALNMISALAMSLSFAYLVIKALDKRRKLKHDEDSNIRR